MADEHPRAGDALSVIEEFPARRDDGRISSLREQALLEVPDHALIGRIGRGSYGDVWLARNIFGTLRAVKVVHRQHFSEEYPFEREFKGIQKYEPLSRRHEGLVAVLQIGRNDRAGYFYYVMELADHSAAADPDYLPKTLREELRRRGRLPLDELLAIGLRLTAALELLHGAGLVHRDIKPSNIIFVSGVPKLADIGLVAEVDEARSFVGTMGFIPPEGPGQPQADIYALGKVLYEMLSGKDRHEFPALPEEFLGHPKSDRSSSAMAERRRLIDLNQIVLRACESNLRQRYASAQALREDLVRLERGGRLARRSVFRRIWTGRNVAILSEKIVAGASSAEQESALPEVNYLFEKGHLCALGATPERLRQAGRYFGDALERDSKFIPAHVGLFRVRLLELTALPKPPEGTLAGVREAAARLMAMVPSGAEARMASSLMRYLEGKVPRALAEIREAAQLPALSRQTRAISHNLAGAYLLDLEDPAGALNELRLSEKEVPTCAIGQVALGHPYFVQSKFHLALAQYRKSVELEPRQWLGHFWSGRALEELGDFSKAIQEFEQADWRILENETSGGDGEAAVGWETTREFYACLRRAFQGGGPDGYWRQRLDAALKASPQDPHYLATVYARLGQTEEAYAWLARAAREGKLVGLCFDPCWDRNDLRFKAAVRA